MTAAMLYLDLLDRGLRLRIDDDDRLIVSPGGKLTARDRVAIRRHKDELMAIVAIDALAPEEEPDTGPATDRTGQPVPSGCLGPIACAAIGICGRPSCLAGAEREAFEGAVVNARAERNPHRVTRLTPDDISATTPSESEEDARAA